MMICIPFLFALLTFGFLTSAVSAAPARPRNVLIPADSEPARVADMAERWQAWAEANHVLPWPWDKKK